MEDQVDLNALIKRDKVFNKHEKRHPIHKNARRHPYIHNNNLDQDSSHSQEKWRRRKQKQIVKNPKSYALFIKGFVSDVSIDDIINMAQNRKIISVKTQLKQQNRPINPNSDKDMEVTISFAEKEQANSFVQEYSDKLLDGKHSLIFQFRRE